MRQEAGQSLVELALIVPLFTLLIVGAVEFGELAYAAIEVSNAARAGVAYGAQSFATAADSLGMQTAAQNDAANINGLTAVASQFCSCSTDAKTPVGCSTAQTTCSAAGGHVLNYVQVTTTATITPIAHLFSTSFTLNGLAIMRVEQ